MKIIHAFPRNSVNTATIFVEHVHLHVLSFSSTLERLNFGLKLNVLKHLEDFNLKCFQNVLRHNR